jgi:hypothetical protein
VSNVSHFIWKKALGTPERLPLSRDEYACLKKAWEILIGMLDFEEEFDNVIQNYIDLEQGFLSTAIHSMVRSRTDLVEFRKVRIKFARLLSNLLSSCRSYLDHSPHHLRQVADGGGESFKEKTSAAYNSEFAYRFMEALRNYAQHRGSPLHGTTFSSRRVERDETGFGLQYSIWASVDVEKLRSDPKFKRSILAGVTVERIDVLALCRIYVEKLGELHVKMRDELASQIDDAKGLLRAALTRYESETGNSSIGVGFALSKNDRTVDKFQGIPEDIIELYESLVKQNRQVINLRHRFVSNELLPERTTGLP